MTSAVTHMKSMMRAATPAAAGFLLIALLTSCSLGGSGPTAPPSLDAPSHTSPSPSGSPPSPLAGIEPCNLVSSQVRAAYALTDPQEKQLGDAHVCRFRLEGETLRLSYTVSIELFDGLGIDDIWAPDVEQLPDMGSHPAARFSGPGESCRLALGVSESARIDVTANGGDFGPACDLVTALAEAIEPDVP